LQIAVIGAGAMGSLFGAMLSSVSDVYLINPFGAHLQAIKENGLIIEKSDSVSETYYIFATADPKEVKAEIDLAIIFTKSYNTEEAAQIAKTAFGAERAGSYPAKRFGKPGGDGKSSWQGTGCGRCDVSWGNAYGTGPYASCGPGSHLYR